MGEEVEKEKSIETSPKSEEQYIQTNTKKKKHGVTRRVKTSEEKEKERREAEQKKIERFRELTTLVFEKVLQSMILGILFTKKIAF